MVILSPTRVVFSGQTVLATAPNYLELFAVAVRWIFGGKVGGVNERMSQLTTTGLTLQQLTGNRQKINRLPPSLDCTSHFCKE